MADLLFMITAAGVAGFIDAIVGGGGLVLVPALFSTYPSTPAATLFGTNKCASVWGTAWAARQYARQVTLNWRSLLPAAAAAFGASLAGAWLVARVSSQSLRNALPLVLMAVLVYTLIRKDLGRVHSPKHPPRAETLWACAIGCGIGLYDGFFGPGAGSFFVFLLVRVLGWDFLHASAGAKLLNLCTNLAALLLFGSQGHVWWALGLCMAAANIAGSMMGARLALRQGAGFVRVAFILVVSALILRAAILAWWH